MPRTCRVVDPAAPAVEAVDIADIASGLARIGLFGPQAIYFYPLAQHAQDVMRAAAQAGVTGPGTLAALHCYAELVYAYGYPLWAQAWRETIATAFGFESVPQDVIALVTDIRVSVEVEAAGALLSDGGSSLADAHGVKPAGLLAHGPTRVPGAPRDVEEALKVAHARGQRGQNRSAAR